MYGVFSLSCYCLLYIHGMHDACMVIKILLYNKKLYMYGAF
jgi:hypothetical protein